MFHPYARIAGYFDETLDGYRGPGNCIWSQEFYETDRSRGFVRGYTFEFSRGQGPVMAAVHGMQIGRLPWGADHHRAYRSLFCHRTGMVAICEDLPEEHNTVTLDPVLKDSNGIPGAEDRLHAEREQPPHAGSRGGAGQRDPACRGRARRLVTRRRSPTAAGI